jgi:hypothetical protein
MPKWGDTKPGPHGPYGLCGICKHATIREDDRGQVTVQCSYHRLQRIFRPLVHCSDHQLKTQAEKWDMEQIAWIIQADKRTGKLGFKPPAEEKE